ILGDGPKTAVLFTLDQKYGIAVKGPVLAFEGVGTAILDLFGQDGGRMLLEKMWVNMEVLAESQIKSLGPQSKEIDIHQTIQTVRAAHSDQDFNDAVSRIFAEFVSETFGEDIYTWLEGMMRDRGTTLKNLYFDADKISDILWATFSSAASFVID